MSSYLWIFDAGFRRLGQDETSPPGWAWHMGFFISLGFLMLVCVGFGVPPEWVLPLVGMIDLLGTIVLVRHICNRMLRLGAFGPLRARWWIEVAALTLTLGFACGIFAVTGGVPGAGVWQNKFFWFVVFLCPKLILASFVLATIGFGVGLLQRKQIRGRSLELVAFFYWVHIGGEILEMIPAAFALKVLMPFILAISFLALLAAGIVALQKRVPLSLNGNITSRWTGRRQRG